MYCLLYIYQKDLYYIVWHLTHCVGVKVCWEVREYEWKCTVGDKSDIYIYREIQRPRGVYQHCQFSTNWNIAGFYEVLHLNQLKKWLVLICSAISCFTGSKTINDFPIDFYCKGISVSAFFVSCLHTERQIEISLCALMKLSNKHWMSLYF